MFVKYDFPNSWIYKISFGIYKEFWWIRWCIWSQSVCAVAFRISHSIFQSRMPYRKINLKSNCASKMFSSWYFVVFYSPQPFTKHFQISYLHFQALIYTIQQLKIVGVNRPHSLKFPLKQILPIPRNCRGKRETWSLSSNFTKLIRKLISWKI